MLIDIKIDEAAIYDGLYFKNYASFNENLQI